MSAGTRFSGLLGTQDGGKRVLGSEPGKVGWGRSMEALDSENPSDTETR